MIAHVSIPAKQPEIVAKALGKIIDGSVFSFPVVPGAYIVVANDFSGQAIEVYPSGMTHHPGTGEAPAEQGPPSVTTKPWEDQIFIEAQTAHLSSHHMALSTKLSEQEIVDLGRALEFRTVPCDRAGVFKLVELWIDNSYLIEILTETETKRYAAFMNPKTAAEMFGKPIGSWK